MKAILLIGVGRFLMRYGKYPSKKEKNKLNSTLIFVGGESVILYAA